MPKRSSMFDLEKTALLVGAALKERKETVAVAESSSGGLICAALLAMPGASSYFKGGGVVYTSQAKTLLVEVSAEEMQKKRAATEEHALALARAARERLGADWGIGETGAAGPTGNRYGDAAGHSCIAVVGPCEKARTLATNSPERAANMQAFAAAAIALLQECVGQD